MGRGRQVVCGCFSDFLLSFAVNPKLFKKNSLLMEKKKQSFSVRRRAAEPQTTWERWPEVWSGEEEPAVVLSPV